MTRASGQRAARRLCAVLGACCAGLAGGSACNAPDPASPEELTVRVRGSDYRWHVRYPGADGVLDTGDDVEALRDLHVPVKTHVEVKLESDDYIYVFRVPDFDVNEMAVPELHFTATLRAAAEGTHELKGDQMCGFRHPELLGQVFVHDAAGFAEWLESARP